MPWVSTKESLIPVVRGECPIPRSIRSLGLPTQHITRFTVGRTILPHPHRLPVRMAQPRREMSGTGSEARNRPRP